MELLIPSVKRPGSGVKANHTAQMRVQITHGNPPFDIGKIVPRYSESVSI
jgi:hypothetical protein